MARPRSTSDAEILSAARDCFLEQGAGVSTTVIAGRLGISHAVLFQRFGTKEELMRAALRPPVEETWLEPVKRGPDERPVRAQLLEIAIGIHAALAQIIPAMSVLRSAKLTPDAPPESHRKGPLRTRTALAEWFARAAKAGRVRKVKPEHAADLLLGALQARPFYQHVSGRRFPAADTRAYLEFTVDALWRVLDPSGGGE